MFGIKEGDVITFISSKVKAPYKKAEAVVTKITEDRITCVSNVYPSILTIMDVWCVKTVNGKPYNPIDKKSIEWKVATAINCLDNVLMGMGDDYNKYVESLCKEAGVNYLYIDSDLPFGNTQNIDNVAKKAYYFLLKGKNMQMMADIIARIKECQDALQCRMAWWKCNTSSRHPITKAVTTIAAFVKENISLYEDIHSVEEVLLTTDVELCALGFNLGREVYKYLDERFVRTNDAFTVGSMMLEDDNEKELGYYVFHATKKNPSSEGFSIALNRVNEQIVISFYKYKRNCETFEMRNEALDRHIVVTNEKNENLAQIVAKIINNFL